MDKQGRGMDTCRRDRRFVFLPCCTRYPDKLYSSHFQNGDGTRCLPEQYKV